MPHNIHFIEVGEFDTLGTFQHPFRILQAGDLASRGKAPRRTAGVMRKYLNPWALEVIARHPEITVCDQWRFVKHHQDDLFLAWWKGKNVHFRGEPATALGRLLADHVLRVTSR